MSFILDERKESDELKNRQDQPISLEDLPEHLQPRSEEDPIEEASMRGCRETLISVLNYSVPDRERQVVSMRYGLGLYRFGYGESYRLKDIAYRFEGKNKTDGSDGFRSSSTA